MALIIVRNGCDTNKKTQVYGTGESTSALPERGAWNRLGTGLEQA